MESNLEQRTFLFARNARDFCRKLKLDAINSIYIKQLIRSSSSVGANYIEANENLGQGDLKMKLKIARKEAKETGYWLQLLILDGEVLQSERDILLNEALQVRKILSAILLKVQ